MLNSIRWSLQVWHAGLLAVVLTSFGTVSYYTTRRARYQEVDAQLERSVQLLAAGLRYPHRPLHFQHFDGNGGGPPPEWSKSQPPDMTGNSQITSRDHRFDTFGEEPKEIEVPPALAARFGDGAPGSPYFFIWDYDHGVTKTSRAQNDVPDPSPRLDGVPKPPSLNPPIIRQRGDLREAFLDGPAGSKILVGQSILPDQAAMQRSALLLAATGGGILLLGLIGGWLLFRRAVKPIDAITATAKKISATNLSRRIDVAETHSELGDLATVLNDMFNRLDAAFQQQIRFTADASHELRTPLSVIHTNSQLALSRERSADEYRRTIETCLRASGRMKNLVDSLLVLAKADAGGLKLERSACDLDCIVKDSIALVAAMAQEKHITLDSALEHVILVGDPSKLAQVVTNLLTNAVRYNHEGGRASVTLRREGDGALLIIADTGIGIPLESQAHIFERFYRVDPARSRELGGSGLGLAICQSNVIAHKGSITLESSRGNGSTFTVRLPLNVGEPGSVSPKVLATDPERAAATSV